MPPSLPRLASHSWPATTPSTPEPEHDEASFFLQRHGVRRLGPLTQDTLEAPPNFCPDNAPRTLNWSAEMPLSSWRPLEVEASQAGSQWRSMALRFSTSCDAGRDVAWPRDMQGHPVPLRLAQVGARSILLRAHPQRAHEATSTWSCTERVVALPADRFEWQEIEAWSTLLMRHGFRLLIVPAAEGDASSQAARERTQEEALRLERQSLRACGEDDSLLVVDGPLALRRGVLQPLRAAIGVCAAEPLLPPLIKPEWQPETLASPETADFCSEETLVPPAVRRVLRELRPGQRTPAWCCDEPACPLMCWFVRLHEAPARAAHRSGIVRVEVKRELWESQGDALGFATALSGLLLETQAPNRSRLWPHERAGQQLRQMLIPASALEALFARVCGL